MNRSGAARACRTRAMRSLQGRYLFAGSRSQTAAVRLQRRVRRISRQRRRRCGATSTWSGCSTRTWPAPTCSAAFRRQVARQRRSESASHRRHAAQHDQRRQRHRPQRGDFGFDQHRAHRPRRASSILSGAVTLGDVARLIEDGAPAGTDVTVDVTGTGCVLQHAASGTISGRRSGAKAERRASWEFLPIPTAAAEQHDRRASDLNPAVLKTTRLSDLLGTKAQGGSNRRREQRHRAHGGREWRRIQRCRRRVCRRRRGRQRSRRATTAARTRSPFRFKTATRRRAKWPRRSTPKARSRPTVDYHDATSSAQAGPARSTLAALHARLTSRPAAAARCSIPPRACILTNGGQSVTLDISGAETVEDLLNLINGAELGLAGRNQRDRQRHQRALAAERRRFHDRRKRRHDGHAAWAFARTPARRSWPTSIAASACRRRPTLETLDTTKLDQLANCRPRWNDASRRI